MAIAIVTPDERDLGPPLGHRSHPSMMINQQTPAVRILGSHPHHYTPPHSHSEAEVIVILDGKMILNGRWCGPGTVIYVPADEDYWHTAGADGCTMALIRPGNGGVANRTPSAVAE